LRRREIVIAGAIPEPPTGFDFDPAYVEKLSGLKIDRAEIAHILEALGFAAEGPSILRVTPPTWRRDVDGPADLVEEVARIKGFSELPATPLPEIPAKPGGVLTPKQARVRAARRALAAAGYQETIGWSFTSTANAKLFGGGDERLVLANPIASELNCMRPSALAGLIEAVGRNAARGLFDLALFEIGPVFLGDQPEHQRTRITALVSAKPTRSWQGAQGDPLFDLKADLYALLDELGAPTGSLQVAQGAASPWWHPGRSARLQLGPRAVLAEFGALHPGVLKALDVDGPLYGFEITLEAVPEPKKKAVKTRPALKLSPFMPLTRDFAFIVPGDKPSGELVRAAQGANKEGGDKALIASARVFDVYQGPGVPEGEKSVALEVTFQPTDKTLTDVEIEALCARVITAVEKASGGKLRR
jgi:phenylalanyl-tRNA synthetase beta chain